jgi:cell division protein FtsI (penicillin-binding protein 3)
MGDIRLYGTLIHDHKAFGRLTMSEVLTYSSNVGAIKIGLAAGQNQLYRTMRQFGFGEPTGIDLPGESPGIVAALERWSPIAKAYISFGQGVSVTPLQLANAFAAVANGGQLLRPYLVAEISRDGVVATRSHGSAKEGGRAGREVRQVASPASIRSVSRMLEAAVTEGTGKAARAPGYSAAGKTGTAQKAGKGGYMAGRYVASFAGYAPARSPVLVGLVAIDEPLGGRYHGGDVAAPVFGAIAREALLYLGVDGDRQRPQRWPHEAPSPLPPSWPGGMVRAALRDSAPAGQSSATPAVTAGAAVPDFAGLTGRDAFYRSARLGLRPVLHGQGFVAGQTPPAGTPFARGQRIDLVLEKSASPVAASEARSR